MLDVNVNGEVEKKACKKDVENDGRIGFPFSYKEKKEQDSWNTRVSIDVRKNPVNVRQAQKAIVFWKSKLLKMSIKTK
ncbi:hypothetical protein [Ekhidna sp.]|uniref:hypothetical protein n=1 Tax=Ekhidna sp. TaxID=2608089 RepID=UPI003CCB8ED8